MQIQFELRRAHFIIIGIVAVICFVAGYFTARISSTASIQEVGLPAQEQTQRKLRNITADVKPREQQMIAKVARDLNLSDDQKDEIMSVVDKNFPPASRKANSIDITKVYKTIEEIKPLLSQQQSAQLDALIIQHLASGKWK